MRLTVIKVSLLCATLLSAAAPASAQRPLHPQRPNRAVRDSLRTARDQELSGAVVTGSAMKRIGRSAFNAVAIDMTALRNTNLDIAHALDRVAGVSVREEGGVGSAVNINLNGFTGKRVKVFIDGVPMEGSSSSFGINNIPAGLASRVEVYKGVVPVEFGADALGGAINIVTNKNRRTYVDASYSYGSFNTHRSNLNAGYTAPNGLSVSLTAYQNFSDNDYKVRTQFTDLNTNVVEKEERWFRRFHDQYHNEAAIIHLGVVGKSWADRLMLGLTYSHERADIQNANLMKIVFGGKYRTAEGWTPQLNYVKHNFIVPRLYANLSLRYDVVTTNNVDTLSRKYNWAGEWKATDYQGEGVATIAEFRGKTLAGVANLKYTIGSNHFFTFNNTYTNYHRRTTNTAANAVQSTAATFMRRVNIKNVTGLSYKYIPSTRWNAEAFGKYYTTRVTGPVNIKPEGSGYGTYEEQQRSSNALGYGLAGTWFVLPGLQAKLSYEKTYRLPTDRELFGDGDYEEGEVTLRPERSHNLNLNLSYDRTFGQAHTVLVELGGTYRGIGDYIIRTIGQKGTAVSSNHGKVVGLGLDLSGHYYYKDVLTLGFNGTLQNLRDRERLNSIGAPSVTYNNRVPNQPYAFAHAEASYTLKDLVWTGSRLTLGYNIKGVHRFYRTWAGYGAKLFIPNQLSHNANLTLSLREGRYNVALEANNFTNALLYDNYSLQKPGRSFSVKFRYVFSKSTD